MIKKIIVLLLLSFTFSQGYNMQMLSNLTFGQNTSDITGFYQDGREFAVVGLQNAAAFVDVTDPYNPFEVGRISGGNSIWRDLKYWDRHVYIGTEAADGVKVVSVDNLDNPVLVNTITDFTNSHNVYIDEDGFLYVVGASSYAMWIYDLTNPSSPNLVGTWGSSDPGYSQYLHDITVYNDKVYGASIYEGFVYIIDVSDKSNPQTIQLNGQNYFDTGGGYISSHDTAVTPDEQYLFTGDENTGGHVKVWDISNYNNINLVAEYITDPNHSAHNLYYKDGLLFVSYYADGTRVLDVSDPENPIEIAYYDTSSIEGLYVGNWGTYVYLPSGNIISSDIETGLYVLQFGGVSIIHSDVQDVDVVNDSPYVIFQATVESFDGDVDSVTLNYSLGNANWSQVTMYENGNSNVYDAVMTFDQVDVIVNYYITASSSTGQDSRYPQGDEYVSFIYGDLQDIVQDSFEQQSGWTVGDSNDTATTGIWTLADPNGTYLYDSIVQPEYDHTDPGSQCFVTGNAGGSNVGNDDIDNGKTTLFSPVYNLSDFDDVLVSYWYWYSNNQGNAPGSEDWQVYVSNNAASSMNPVWTPFQVTNVSTSGWERYRSLLSDVVDLTSQVQFKFVAEDRPENDGCLVEAALDDFLIESYGSSNFIEGDLNDDSTVNILDVVLMVGIVIGEIDPSPIQFSAGDINLDGAINVQDIVLLVNIVLGS